MYNKKKLRNVDCSNIVNNYPRTHVISSCLSYLNSFGLLFFLTFLFFSLEMHGEKELNNQKSNNNNNVSEPKAKLGQNSILFKDPLQNKKIKFDKNEYDNANKTISFRIINIPPSISNEINIYKSE